MPGKDRARKFRQSHPEYMEREAERLRIRKQRLTEEELEKVRLKDRERKKIAEAAS